MKSKFTTKKVGSYLEFGLDFGNSEWRYALIKNQGWEVYIWRDGWQLLCLGDVNGTKPGPANQLTRKGIARVLTLGARLSLSERVQELLALAKIYKQQGKDMLENAKECELEAQKLQEHCRHVYGPPYHVAPTFMDPVEGDVCRDCAICEHVHVCHFGHHRAEVTGVGRCPCR